MKSLITLLFFSFFCSSGVIHASSIESCFIEEIKIDPDFEFYNVLYSVGNPTRERSDHFSQRNFKGFLWDHVSEENLFVTYNNRSDETVYLKIKLDELTIGGVNQTSLKSSFFKFQGVLEFTDFRGNMLKVVDLSDDFFTINKELKIYDTDGVSWTKPIENGVVNTVTELLLAKIIKYIGQMDVTLENSSETISISRFDSSFNLQNVFDPQTDQRILGIITQGEIQSGTLLDASGYFVCDYKVIYNLERIRVITYNGDTLSAKLIRSNKSWDIALCKLEMPLSSSSLTISSKIHVGDEVFIRGHTGSLKLPILCVDGNVLSRIERDLSPFFLLSAGSSDNFSGAPVLNRKGELLGIVIVTGREQGEEIFGCILYSALFDLLNLKQL